MRYMLFALCILVAGCDTVRSTKDRLFGGDKTPVEAEEAVVEEVAAEEPIEPEPVATTAVGWVGAKTTIAGLGDPTTPGRWLETSLVDVEVTGRVVVPKTGSQAYITLVPAPGPESGGSRLSLDAMRALLLPFDELVELEVYSN
ncbi:hypothetical protein RUE5091_00515 [Ruegeria denitrificans]|uniref:D-galactarate dehydratase n=1 Tax=Ruegeria denitrificans TaxID=1715692 RepID=A0A0P1IE53_9RHOB|nr:hypothetical protein [Ruegeria denitrificans]CUJ86810.1 hypothetical protein RUE5091_00515 [Ruegeria denitrificans]